MRRRPGRAPGGRAPWPGRRRRGPTQARRCDRNTARRCSYDRPRMVFRDARGGRGWENARAGAEERCANLRISTSIQNESSDARRVFWRQEKAGARILAPPVPRTHEYVRPGLYCSRPKRAPETRAPTASGARRAIQIKPRANVLVSPGAAAGARTLSCTWEGRRPRPQDSHPCALLNYIIRRRAAASSAQPRAFSPSRATL